MKYTADIEFMSMLDTDIARSISPDITLEDIKVLEGLLSEADMSYRYIPPQRVNNMLFMDVYYKYPHEFIDDAGNKFCVGYYTRNVPVEKLSKKIMQIIMHKTYQRDHKVENDDWHTHYSITFKLYGHAWPYGHKDSIIGHTPVGMKDIYRYADDSMHIQQDIKARIETIKRYIDGGKSMVK